MWCRSYRNHVIMAFPSFDTATGLWAPQANISWVEGPARKSEFVRFAKRVMTEGDAVAVALTAAHAWIDRRLRTLDKPPQFRTYTEGAIAGAAPLPGSDPTKLARAPKASRSAPRMLTYGQFKSLMEKSGLAGNERSLQKSYTALVQLRKQVHCSWAQIKFRMKHSQESAAAAHTKTKTTRLPLTPRDWRRVI